MSRATLIAVLVAAVSSAVVTFALSMLAFPVEGRAAPMQQAATVIRAERFELVDAGGAVRAQLGTIDHGVVGLAVLEPSGQPRALIGLEPSGTAGMFVTDPGGQPRAGLAVSRDANAVLRLNTAQGTSTTLSADPDGSGALLLADASGLRTGLVLTGDARPGWFLRDPAGEQRASLFLTREGAPSMQMHNVPGPTLRLGMFPDGGSGFDVVASETGEAVGARIFADGTPSLAVRSRQGQVAGLAGTPQGSVLSMNDADGQPRAAIAATADAGTTLLVRADGGASLVLTAQPDNRVGLAALDENRQPRARLGVAGDGAALMEIGDRLTDPQSARVALGELPDGSRGLAVKDEDRPAGLLLGVAGDGRPTVVLRDEAGQTRAGLGLQADGAPAFRLFNEMGQTVWQAP